VNTLNTLKPLLWSLRRQVSAMGWPGVAGAVLIALSLAFAASAIVPLETRIGELKADVASLRAKLQSAPATAAEVAAAGDPLTNFYAFFPPLGSTPEWLQRIFSLAEAQGLRLEAGEYRLKRERDFKLARYELTLPVRGGYPQIREFVSQVLTEVPASSLDELSLRREDSASATVEARIRLTLHLAGEPLR
jgi:Tfp pilus assembly protein PilO